MKCPGCGGELKPESVIGFDYSYRCDKCGGWWVANWVVNNLAEGKAIQAEPVRASLVQQMGRNVCPSDGSALARPAGKSAPEGAVLECRQCGWWWFAGDEIFKFAEAFKAREEYVRVWRHSEWAVYAWPALGVAVMLVGLTTSVGLVRNRQRTALQAAQEIGVYSFVAIPWGEGEMEIRFKSAQLVGGMEYRWLGPGGVSRVAEVEQDKGWYRARLTGLQKGKYEAVILGQKFEFEVK